MSAAPVQQPQKSLGGTVDAYLNESGEEGGGCSGPEQGNARFLLQRELGRLDGLNQKFVRKNVQVRGSPTFLSLDEKFFIYLSSDGVWVICPVEGPHGSMVKPCLSRDCHAAGAKGKRQNHRQSGAKPAEKKWSSQARH